MITLTTPAQINSVLGGTAPVDYNKLVIGPFTLNPTTGNVGVSGSLRLTSTAVPAMDPITGSLTVDIASGVLVMSVPQLDFLRRVVLTGPQVTAVQTIITNAQNALETGIVNLGVVAGTQSSGV